MKRLKRESNLHHKDIVDRIKELKLRSNHMRADNSDLSDYVSAF